ncbi:unnamed protein product [Paramecium primaurelia]|uniref:Insulin-like growth factor binding protein, N-terminal n=1 Tax=Paramecium primaurelia TaxID=5886 RepID=A0A8S1KWX0_PARPR|nr:unnamed protein product [Paramecium primaurelia]
MIAENTYWGITEFQLSINECSNGCNFCNSQECFNQQLYLRLFNQKVFTVVNDEEGWQSGVETVNQIKECYGFNYIVSPGDNLHKIFDLEQHNLISFQVKLLIFNSESTNIHIYLDDNLVFATNFIYQQLKLPGYVCDYISFKEINLFQQQHSSKRLKIAIHVELIKKDNSNNLSTYIGIRDFLLFVNKDFDFICCDNNIIPFDGCFSNNYDCIQGCANCIKGICYDCLIGWEYKESTKSCIPSCGNSIINHYEECDDGNLVANDGCHNCQFSCPKNCLNCQFGKCLKCETQYQIIEGMCSYVRDGFENTHFEENKVDYNFLIIERQFNEQLKQQDGNCKVEQFGKCLECQDGYELNFNKKHCIPKCQDGIILSQEICDDGNSIQFDGCYKCQKSCQIECLFCSDNKCYNCQDGWQLQDYQCKQICGDGQIAILSQEQCDNIEDSNCTDCNYQCDHDCLVCDKFQNCEICQSSFEINDGKCIPICGDQIIISLFEQCDDGNDIPYDGCYQCQYQCSFGCIKCEKDNHCILCDEQQYYILDIQTFKCKQQQDITYPESKEQINNTQLLIVQCNQNQEFINNECVNLCGNGILNSLFEQCDDGNNNGGDGCSALCFEEDSYLCINQDKVLSICTFVQSPNFELTLLSDIQNQTKILELGFSQQVYIQSEQLFENIIEFIIIPQTQYVLSFNPLTNISNQLAYPKYQILVQFLEPVNEPILQINIQKFSIYNQYDLELNTNTKQIRLGTPFVLSQTTQQKVNQIIKMNDAIVYSTVSISAFLFLTGNYIVFFNLLDLLQSISYIRYMQYKFPPHLSQFLETYTKISLQPILDKLRVDELIIKLNGVKILTNKYVKLDVFNECQRMLLFLLFIIINIFCMLSNIFKQSIRLVRTILYKA